MGNPFGDQVKSARLRAESLSAEGRWAEAAEAFEDLANAWIASCATVSPAARKDRLDEVAAARKMLSDLADMEQEHMPEYKRTEYVAESDRLWEHLKQRTAVYVRKIDRIEAAHPELVEGRKGA